MLQSIQQVITRVRDLCQSSLEFTKQILAGRDDEVLLSSLRGEAFSAHSVYQHARRTLESGHSAHTELQFLPLMKAASDRVYKPVFALALQGDGHMRDEYLRGRIAQLSYLPAWVTTDCKKIAKGSYEEFDLYKHVAGGRRHSHRTITLDSFNDHTFSTIFINYLVTINEMQNFCREVREHHYAKGKIQELQTVYFNPVSHCPLGNAARGALSKCVQLITAARIVTDMALVFDIELPEQTAKTLVRTHLLNPWGVASDPIFRRMFEITDILTSSDVKISNEERTDLLLRCISGSPSMRRYTSTQDEKPTLETKTQGKLLQSPEVDTQGSFLRNVVVDAIYAKIAARDQTASRALARDLYKDVRRNKLVFSDVMTGLSRGLTAEELLSNSRQHDDELSTDVMEEPRPNPDPPAAETTPDDREPLSPKMNIELTPAAKAWLEDLNDKETRNRIHRRLERMKDGHLGDHKCIRGSVYELRDGRYRIYYRKVSVRHVLILTLGDKSSQKQDIKAFQSL